MRKTILALSAATAALALAACSETADDTVDTTAETEMDDMDAATGTDAATADSDAVLDASTATTEQLVAAGLSRQDAETVVNGQPYDSVVDLADALPEATRSEALTRVFVPIDLNTASEEEIRLIPGMTDKMVHEFEEYRPYENMAEFDREIGKYVDADEVARFRRYVMLGE